MGQIIAFGRPAHRAAAIEVTAGTTFAPEETFESIGEAADKLVARLRAELGPPSEVILFAPDVTTNIGTVPPRSKRRESNRNAGYRK